MEARAIKVEREWLDYTGAAIASRMLDQVAAPLLSRACCAMIQAGQELLLATRWQHIAPPLLIIGRSRVEWRFESVSYLFLPRIDDRIFPIYKRVRKRAGEVVVLVPPRHEWLVRAAFERQQELHQPSSLFAVDDYICWRTMWACPDTGWTNRKVLLWWLSRYNRFIRRKEFPDRLLARLNSP